MTNFYHMYKTAFALLFSVLLCPGVLWGAETIHYPDENAFGGREYRVALILVNTVGNMEDNPKTKFKKEFYTPEFLGNLFFRHPDGVGSFIREASYGRVRLSGVVAGWYLKKGGNLSGEDVIKDYHSFVNLAGRDIDLKKYDIIYLCSLLSGRGGQVGWRHGQQTLRTSKGVIRGLGLIFMTNSSVFEKVNDLYSQSLILPSTSWAHELIHTLGINGHANSYDCGPETINHRGKNPIKAYGNPFSLMGESAFAVHPDIIMKKKLGWLTPRQIITVKRSGQYIISPLETNDGRVKGLEIPLQKPITHTGHKMAFDRIYVEYREPIGFDRHLMRLDGGSVLKRYKPNGGVDRNGVLILAAYRGKQTQASCLLDMNPGTPFDATRGIKQPGNAGKFADAFLTAGNRFREEKNQLEITTIGPASHGMKVEVRLQ